MQNASANPFATARLEALRFRLDGQGWQELLARGEVLGWRAALVGPPGSGKTTLLLELEQRLAPRFRSLRRVRSRVAAPPSREDLEAALADLDGHDLVTVDGAEQFGPWSWWRLRRRVPGPLLITSHHRGRMPILHEHRSHPGLLADLVGELAPTWAALANRPDLDALHARHQGDLRACLLACYDHWAGRTRGRAGDVPGRSG